MRKAVAPMKTTKARISAEDRRKAKEWLAALLGKHRPAADRVPAERRR